MKQKSRQQDQTEPTAAAGRSLSTLFSCRRSPEDQDDLMSHYDLHLHQALDQPSDDQKDDDHDAWPESHFVSPVDDEDHIVTTRFDNFYLFF